MSILESSKTHDLGVGVTYLNNLWLNQPSVWPTHGFLICNGLYFLLAGYCLNLAVDGTTPLVEAAHRGNIEILDLLINSGSYHVLIFTRLVHAGICASSAK